MIGVRPRPRLDADNRAFWTGGAAGELRIMQCRTCRGFIHPPRAVCRHCLSEDVEPVAVRGTGTIDSFTVNHQPWASGMPVPFVIARVALDDAAGVTLTTNIVNSPVESVVIGDRVRVLFEEQDGIFYPLFEKAG